jgi:protein TonB
LTEDGAPSTLRAVHPRRRHLLIWTAVTTAHLAALAGVWISGGPGRVVSPAPEGGLMLVLLTPEPIALPGEQPQGQAVGAGAPVAELPRPAVVALASRGVAVSPLSPVVDLAPAPGPAVLATVGPVAAVARPATFTPPAFVERVEPLYPERARRAGVEGVVTVRIRLDATGAILAVELVQPSGSRWLDEAALAAAHASRFAPAARESARVASEALATYRFELR